MGFLVFFGWMLLIGSIGTLVWSRVTDNDNVDKVAKYSKWTVVLSFVFIMWNSLFFLADAGTTYTLQYPYGGYETIVSNGITMKNFASVIPVDQELVIKDLTPDEYQRYLAGDRQESDASYVSLANQSTFNDKISGWLESTVIIDVNHENEDYTNIVLKGKSEENIVRQRILPVIRNVKANTAKLFSTDDFISGAKVQYDEYFRDQLNNGAYALDQELIEDYVEPITTANGQLESRQINISAESQNFKYVIRKDSNGNIVRQDDGLRKYGFEARQATIEEEQWSDDFEKALAQIVKIAAEAQEAKREAEKYKWQAEKEREFAESEKIKERGAQEKDQISVVIAAETDAKKAQFKKQEEEYLLSAAKVKEERIRIEASNTKRLRNAGIDPVVELRMHLDNQALIYKHLAGPNGITLPSNYVTTGEGGSSNGSNDLLMAILAGKMLETNSGGGK